VTTEHVDGAETSPSSAAALLRFVLLLGAWAAVGAALVFTVPTLLGATPHRVYALLQMITPWLGIAAGLPFLIAVIYRQRVLVVVSGFCVLVNVLPVWGAVSNVDKAPPSRDDLSVYVANLRYNNDTPEKAIDQALASDADVLVLVELTDDYAQLLQQRGVDQRYPDQAIYPDSDATGIGIYSRRLVEDTRTMYFDELRAPVIDVSFGEQSLQIIAIHTIAPRYRSGLAHWKASLDAINQFAQERLGPTLLAGDFNATRWHPPFRQLLDDGFSDAHERVGQGLTTSWPADGRLGPIGPFARLDHALVHDVGVVSVKNMGAAGSDHRPFLVTITPQP
jgi:endonuclease/exonuclease/phosphatase (EEP) superfamily protein YafD